MKNFLLVGMAGALLLSGCSGYKASRTPDDVYYSPAKPAVEKLDLLQNLVRKRPFAPRVHHGCPVLCRVFIQVQLHRVL